MAKSFCFIFLLVTLFSSCENSTSNKQETPIPNFLKAYKSTKLPITIKGCSENGLPLISMDSLNADNEDGTLPYCTFKTNGNYYAVIRLGLADCTLPSLITYDEHGKLIDEEFIAIGYCGSGPGFHCEESTIINQDFSIYTADTIATTEMDTLGNEIASTLKKYIIYKKGKLLSSGKIELSDTLRKTLVK